MLAPLRPFARLPTESLQQRRAFRGLLQAMGYINGCCELAPGVTKDSAHNALVRALILEPPPDARLDIKKCFPPPRTKNWGEANVSSVFGPGDQCVCIGYPTTAPNTTALHVPPCWPVRA